MDVPVRGVAGTTEGEERVVGGAAFAPELEKWMVDLGLMKDGVLTERAGDPSFFLKR